jgi:hypothetical protein
MAGRTKDNVYRFRSVKWGDPEQKLKMIPSDDRSTGAPWPPRALECGIIAMAFAAGIVGGLLLF